MSDLAPVLADAIRDLAAERQENAALAEALASAVVAARRFEYLLRHSQDFNAWLQRELCRARDWTVHDVAVEWRAELDRREAARKDVAA